MANIRIVFDITISKLIIFATKREKSMNILLLIGGLILILLGANGLTDGAASVAKRFRIPPIVIGLLPCKAALVGDIIITYRLASLTR